MNRPELLEYVIRALSVGKSDTEIREALSESGWSREKIDAALTDARALLSPEQPPPSPPRFRVRPAPEIPHISLGRVFLFLGGLIVVLAAAIFIGVNWDEWGDLARFAAILLPALACYIAGMWIWHRTPTRAVALAFLITAAILTPFVLATLFAGVHIFAEAFGAPTWATAFAISMPAFLILGWRFRNPPWTLLIGMDSIALVYAALVASGIPEFDESAATLWWLLLLSALILLLALILERQGALLDARYLYALGVALLFVMLLALTISGRLVGDIVGSQEQTVKPFGYSAFAAGIIYLLLAWLLIRLMASGFVEFSRYRGFFGFLGALGILGGIALLGSDGHYPVPETLLLIFSLSFILISTWRKVHSFLWLGTLFLVIYVFGMAFEYFRDQVGWPLALFAAGLVSMLVGYFIERLRRTHLA